MSEYVKTCTFCKQEIQMSDKDGRWLPYSKDGSQHECKKKNGNDKVTVEALVQRLESLGIKLDLERVMAQ